MTALRQLALRMIVGGGLVFMAEACAPTLRWVQDPLQQLSCIPDRLLQWSDFVPRSGKDSRAAETAIRFALNERTHTLQAIFQPEHSWVKPELADPQNPVHWRLSEQLLAHEQLHYLISCLVVRQANLALTPNDNLFNMLELTRSVAQRINLQYDKDTHHGTKPTEQDAWQKEVMKQFAELGSTARTSMQTPVSRASRVRDF